jgi:CBS domain-containing protein
VQHDSGAARGLTRTRTISGFPDALRRRKNDDLPKTQEVRTMLVKDVMTERVVTIAPSASLKEAAQLMIEHGISGLPVVEERRVIGVLSDRDFLVKEQGPRESSRWLAWLIAPATAADEAKVQARAVRGAMTSPAVTVWKSASLAYAAQKMLEADVSRLPVLDGNELVGIVTRTDLVRAFARPDGQIEREIVEDVIGREFWPTGDIHVSVSDGNVDVEGTPADVDDDSLRRLIARVPGVVSVTLHE